MVCSGAKEASLDFKLLAISKVVFSQKALKVQPTSDNETDLLNQKNDIILPKTILKNLLRTPILAPYWINDGLVLEPNTKSVSFKEKLIFLHRLT